MITDPVARALLQRLLLLMTRIRHCDEVCSKPANFCETHERDLGAVGEGRAQGSGRAKGELKMAKNKQDEDERLEPDEKDGDYSNILTRAGYLLGMAVKLPKGSEDRLFLLRSYRSLLAYAMSDKLALYFGYGDGGHFLRGPRRQTLKPQQEYPDFPWSLELLDCGLLKNRKVPDDPDGRVHWTCGGKLGGVWHAFFWWDRSGDKRPRSNSGFYVRGFGGFDLETRQAAFAFACAAWPEVVKRQLCPLVLVDDGPPLHVTLT